MKVLLVHNAYSKFSGEEAVVRDITALLESNGHEVVFFKRSSEEIPHMKFGSVRALLSGIYNPASIRAFQEILKKEKPDVINVHNLYPLISPAILPEAKKAGIPVVMTVHNYRLVCPTGLHFSHGEICEKCSGGHEMQCIINNCEGSLAKSAGYAMRNWWARTRKYYLENVTIFACLTRFQQDRLVADGIPRNKLALIPNMVKHTDIDLPKDDDYLGFSGRLSPEKGISTLVEAVKLNPELQFAAAGAYDKIENLENTVPDNFRLLGYCGPDDLARFYNNARAIVLPSVWFEGFPTVLVEAMLHRKPIICSDIGGLSDIVDDGVTGFLVKPGDAQDLAEKMKILWDDPELCKKMGEAGRNKAMTEYSNDKYYERLMRVFNKVTAKSDAVVS